jgi:SAM-dependent methyltransferase
MTSESTIKFFDELAATYESYRLSDWYKAQAELVLPALQGADAGVLLDIGCGTGWLLRRAVASSDGLAGIGVDASGAMILAARQLADSEQIDNLDFIEGDWETLEPAVVSSSAGSRPVVAATCVSCLHYFSDPLAALEKIRRSLVPGGKFVLVERASEDSLLTRIWGFIHRRILRDDVRFYSTGKLREMLTAAGFRDVTSLCNIRKLFWRGKCYTSLAVLEART